MGWLGLGLLGVVLGAMGAEVLRAKVPHLVDKIEQAAKRLADSLCSSDSPDEEKKEK
jgi:hypothetical protein